MSVSQLAALPAAQKHEIDKKSRCRHRLAQKGPDQVRCGTGSVLRRAGPRCAARESGRDFGTAHISDGVLRIKFELPKKTSWDQDMARELAARIVASGDKVEHYFDIKLGSRIPLHELATCPATAVRRCPVPWMPAPSFTLSIDSEE